MVGYSRAAAPVASIGTSFYFARSAKKDTVEPALTVVLSTEVLPRGWAGPRRAARDRTLKPTSTRSGAPDPLSASRRERERSAEERARRENETGVLSPARPHALARTFLRGTLVRAPPSQLVSVSFRARCGRPPSFSPPFTLVRPPAARARRTRPMAGAAGNRDGEINPR